jgi:hypothetical protein
MASHLWCLQARWQLHRTARLQTAGDPVTVVVLSVIYKNTLCFHKQGSAPVIRPLTRDSKRLRPRLSFSVHADTLSTFHDWPGSHPLFQSLVWGTDFATHLWKSLTNTGHTAVKLNPRPLCAYSNALAENKFRVLQVINAYSVGFYDTLPFELMRTAPRLSI